MKKRVYRAMTVATVIVCIVMTLFSWYVVGVIEKDNIKEVLEMRVSSVSDVLRKSEIKYKRIYYDICDDYKSRARALASILSKNNDFLEDELKFEELRMSIGADVISVYDKNLNLEHTIGNNTENENYLQNFKSAINNKLYSAVKIDTSGEIPRIIVGCSRLDKDGIIQIEYLSENISDILNLADISKIFINLPIMQSGSFAIIENETMDYIAHTNSEMIGTPSHFDLQEDFIGEESFFDCEIYGEDVLLHFDFVNNEIVIGYIPYSEIYETRNDTILWIVFAAVVVSTVVILTMRSKVLHIAKSKKQKKLADK